MGSSHSRVSRRRFLVTSAGAGTALLAGCNSGENDDGTPNNATSGGNGGSDETDNTPESTGESGPSNLSLAISSTDSFDPIVIKGDGSTKITQQVYDTLTALPEGSLQPELQLASNVSVSEDNTVYTFQLKEGVQFHNGTEMTAQDFVYSWERIGASPNTQEGDLILGGVFQFAHETDSEGNYVPGSMAVEAVDDYTLRVELAQPFYDALYQFSNGVLSPIPEGIVGDIEGYEGEMSYEEFATRNPVGTGPFTFESFSPGTAASLSAFDEYHGDGLNVAGIDMQVLEDQSARATYANNRNVDMFLLPTSNFDASKVSNMETLDFGQSVGEYGPLDNGDTVNYGTYPTNYTAWFIFNTNKVPKPVRQSIAYVANQQTFVSQGFRDLGQPAYHFTPPSVFPGGAEAYEAHARSGQNSQTTYGENGYPYGVNETRMDEARTTMEEAGYGGDSPYELTFTIYTDRKPDAYGRIAQVLQGQLGSAHIDLSIEREPFSAIIDGAINNRLEFFSLGNGLAYPSPADTLRLAYPTESNFTRWGDIDGKGPQTEAATRAAEAWETVQNNLGRSESAQQTRNEAYLAIEEYNWEDVPALLDYHPIDQQYWYDHVDTTVKTSSFHENQYDTVSLR